jgi:ATP-dependent protease ClpP protease subunit
MRSFVVGVFFFYSWAASAASIQLEGEINKSSMSRMRSQINRAINSGDQNINLYLKSGGGDLKEALQMAAYIRSMGAYARFTTVAQEYCDSSCTVLFAQGQTRKASGKTGFYFHAVGVSGNVPPAKLEEIRRDYARRWISEIRAVDHALASEIDQAGILLGETRPRTYRASWLKSNGYRYVTP